MKTTIPLPKDRELITLTVSGIAVLIGLLWIFFGNQFIALVIPPHTQSIFYYFFSGAIFSLAFIGLYGFIRTILCFSEFMIEQDNLSSLLYENLLKDENEGVFLKSKQGVYKIVSPIAKKILDLDDKRVIGHTDAELHKHVTANRILHEDQRIINFGETIEWETTLKTNLGQETFHCKKYPCRDHRGKIVGIIGVCKNITIIKTFQNLNQQLEGRYQNLFNTLPYPAIVLDSSSMKPYTFNDAMCKLLGYERNEFARMRLSLHIQPDELPAFKDTIVNLHNTGGGEFETTLITKQRDTVNVTGYTQIITIEDNHYLHMLLYDSTETKKSTEILISSELKYRSLFEHANDAIVIVSPNSLNIIDANEIAIRSLGYSRDDIVLLTIQDLDADSDPQITQSKIADLEIYNHALYEHSIKNRNGDIVPVEINAHKLNYGNEDVYQFVIRNIIARKQTEAALITSEQRYRQMFESNMAIKLVIDPENFKIEDANNAASEFYGYSIEDLRGMNLSKINILSRDKLNTLIKQTREQNLGFYSCPHKLANGEIRFVEVRDGPMELEGRQLFYSIIYDVTANKEAENQILVASKMFDYSTDAVMLINDNNQVVSVNYAFTQITDYQQSEIQNSPPEMILANKQYKLINDDVLASIKQTGQWKGEIWHRLKNGQSRPLNASINSINSENNPSSYVVMLSVKHSQPFNLDNTANLVELTKLPNRSLFMDRLQNAIERAKRNKLRLGVIVIDFKNFTQVNKDFGYDMGDKILIAISKRLKYNTRNTDTISHFKSDDFAVLVEDLTDIQQMGIVLQKLSSTLSETYQTLTEALELDVSMGVSIYPEDGDSADLLVTKAQQALSRAQNQDDSHFEMTNSSMNQLANLWLQNEANLHTALRKGQFILNYMPLHNTETASVDSLEALVRWHHPDHGYLLPHQFLPAAEQSGFIGAIGSNVLDQALQQYRLWLDQGVELNQLSINVCESQLDSDFYDILVEKCITYSIKHNQVCLEFSEQNFISANETQFITIDRLHKAGFYIIVDDFGSSSKSLGCLLQSHMSAIKIHHRLMLESQHMDKARHILKSIIALCNSLEIDIIAEGIESERERCYLESLGIYRMQGHFFCEPLFQTEVTDYLESNKNPTS